MAVSRWEEIEKQLPKITAWSEKGLSDKQICHNLGIHPATLYKYKHEHDELTEALSVGKIVADMQVVNALFLKTQGHTFEEVTKESFPDYDDDGKVIGYSMRVTKTVLKEVQSDTIAIQFWLRNRVKDEWADKRETEGKLEVRIPLLEEIYDTFAKARRLHSVEVVNIKTDGSE